MNNAHITLLFLPFIIAISLWKYRDIYKMKLGKKRDLFQLIHLLITVLSITIVMLCFIEETGGWAI